MRIAVAMFGKRIAPRFDHAPELLFIDDLQEGGSDEEKVNVTSLTAVEKIYFLNKRKVDVLLCGGIDLQSASLLRSNGIAVYAWISGEPETALEWYREGVLMPNDYAQYDQHGQWQNRHGHGHHLNA